MTFPINPIDRPPERISPEIYRDIKICAGEWVPDDMKDGEIAGILFNNIFQSVLFAINGGGNVYFAVEQTALFCINWLEAIRRRK